MSVSINSNGRNRNMLVLGYIKTKVLLIIWDMNVSQPVLTGIWN